MSQLVVVGFNQREDARNAMGRLRGLERAGRIRFEDTAVVDGAPPQLPIEIAGDALADQFAKARPRQRRQMRVGQMSEHEGHRQCKACHRRACPGALAYKGKLPERGHRDGPVTSDIRYELPINIPAMNTSTPPTTTWNAACKNGVSM